MLFRKKLAEHNRRLELRSPGICSNKKSVELRIVFEETRGERILNTDIRKCSIYIKSDIHI